LQDYVNRFPRTLNDAILRELPAGEQRQRGEIRWVFPLESDCWREDRDASLFGQLGLSGTAREAAGAWPCLEPCWDGLGLLLQAGLSTPEVLLLEARSHVDELECDGCGADIAALPAILDAFDQTRAWLGADDTPAWLGALYRRANRLAHLHLLRNRFGIGAWLVQLYFLNDPIGPVSRAEWLPVVAGVHARLGLPKRPPFTLEVFLPALNPD
jgi:hypothetical protein